MCVSLTCLRGSCDSQVLSSISLRCVCGASRTRRYSWCALRPQFWHTPCSVSSTRERAKPLLERSCSSSIQLALQNPPAQPESSTLGFWQDRHSGVPPESRACKYPVSASDSLRTQKYAGFLDHLALPIILAVRVANSAVFDNISNTSLFPVSTVLSHQRFTC